MHCSNNPCYNSLVRAMPQQSLSVNNYMRATMAEDRRQSLLLISSERDLEEDMNLDCLADVFALLNLENLFSETLLNKNINSMYWLNPETVICNTHNVIFTRN